jgi:hypothetical protein
MNNSWLIHGNSCFIFNINFHEFITNYHKLFFFILKFIYLFFLFLPIFICFFFVRQRRINFRKLRKLYFQQI